MQQPPEQQQPFGYGPYAPPNVTGSRPTVIVLLRIYAAAIVLLYIGFFVFWQFLRPSSHGNMHSEAALNNMIEMTLIMLAVVLSFGGLHALAALAPFKPWGWTVGLIVICLGLTSCTAVFAIPLLIYWLKPETKAAFCRL